jgi:hypothetical protein
MGGGSLINSIAINDKIEKIRHRISNISDSSIKNEKFCRDKTVDKILKLLKLLSFFACPKITFHNNGCFEKHYNTCPVRGASSDPDATYSDKCICIHIDFIVEHLMIQCDNFFIDDVKDGFNSIPLSFPT